VNRYALAEYRAALDLLDRAAQKDSEAEPRSALPGAPASVLRLTSVTFFRVCSLVELGEFDEAIDWAERDFHLAQTMPHAYRLAHAASARGFVHVRRGDADAIGPLERITAIVPDSATSGPIVVVNVGGFATSAKALTVHAAPTVTGISPDRGGVGTPVVVSGTSFTGATAVTFNGRRASFTVDSAGQITAIVPAGATSGPIAVTTPGGTATSAASFAAAPRITSCTPSNGVIGTIVVVNGANFTGAPGVTFNGTPSSNVTVDSPTRLRAVVPAGATTGSIAVSTDAGTATSVKAFTVRP
jgi:hypothetical protein